ncbi:MAG: DUF1611 domain-containing protein [Pirellula sp.]|jgi:uncharacterized NAD-dependent epimerase/dehydratase family protein|nr:DUF1611 domain-containing protein [Pirellula sp.]
MLSHSFYNPDDKLAVLMHGGMRSENGKTGLSLLRYAGHRVVVVIDRQEAGQSAEEVTRIPLPHHVPVVASMKDAIAYGAETLAIGIAPGGGRLPEDWFVELEAAVAAGLNIMNGLHMPLANHDRLKPLLRAGQWVWDIRKEPEGLSVGNGSARLLPCRRVLFVGTDMSIGKMTAAIEFHRAALSAGWKSKFMATGQTGIMLEGDGIPLDAVRIDYATGAVQQTLMECATGMDVVWIEGQGSFLNPASTATLPLIRGSQPTSMVLVHSCSRTTIKGTPWAKIPALTEVVQMYECVARAGGVFFPAKVDCIALNTFGMTDEEARFEIRKTEKETGLPTSDVVRYGANELLKTVEGMASKNQ